MARLPIHAGKCWRQRSSAVHQVITSAYKRIFALLVVVSIMDTTPSNAGQEKDREWNCHVTSFHNNAPSTHKFNKKSESKNFRAIKQLEAAKATTAKVKSPCVVVFTEMKGS